MKNSEKNKRGLFLTHEEIEILQDCLLIAIYQKTRATDQVSESGCSEEIRSLIVKERTAIQELHKSILDGEKDYN